MSKNYIFTVWTDASSKETENGGETAIGFVIKDGNLPPLCFSEVYQGINNSKGELKAGIESLRTLAEYCGLFEGVYAENCTVYLKTDFNELKNAIKKDKISSKDLEKIKFFNELKEIQKLFKGVKCEEITRWTNIAHNVCYFGNNNIGNGAIEGFFDMYENPQMCVRKKLDRD